MLLNTGPGVGLQLPQALYPTELYNAPNDLYSNEITLNAGDTLPVPNGRFSVFLGNYSVMQVLDPVGNFWRTMPRAPYQKHLTFYGDGFTRRVANLTGCPVAAIIAGGGSSFAAATAQITATVGGSTWQAIVGGSLSITSVTAAGSGYTEAPLVFIPPPPAPGIPATAYATISAGTVASVSLVNFGAGYTTAPTITILPNPSDTNFGSITTATATCALTNSGAITGALCTNSGAPLATLSALTLTASGGAGSGATITPVILQTVTANSIVAGGVGFGAAAAPALITSVGGLATSTSAIKNPFTELTGFVPRPYMGQGTSNAGGTITALTTIDGGLFAFTPTAVAISGAGGLALSSTAVAPSITFTMGGTQDTVWIQPV